MSDNLTPDEVRGYVEHLYTYLLHVAHHLPIGHVPLSPDAFAENQRAARATPPTERTTP